MYSALQHSAKLAGRSRSLSLLSRRTLCAPSAHGTWKIKMLHDGDCPLCEREVEMLKRRDRDHGRIAFVDIASPSYDPEANAGISWEAAMERIHAIRPDGTVLQDIAVFRALYKEVGLGWVYAVTELPVIGGAANALYDFWARRRLAITGREDMQVLKEMRSRGGASCAVNNAADAS